MRFETRVAPDEAKKIPVTMTATLALGDWTRIAQQIRDGETHCWPLCDLIDSIRKISDDLALSTTKHLVKIAPETEDTPHG